MGYASKLGRARISSRNPRAAAICDRCGFVYNHVELTWQFDYGGSGLINKRILVCRTCNDVPQNQLRSIVLPADPIPIENPRIQDYASAESNTRAPSAPSTTDPLTGIPVYALNTRVTSNNNADGDIRSTQITGQASGSKNAQPGTDINAIMPLLNQTKYGVNLPVASVTTDGVSVLTVTCSSGHNLSTGDLIAVEGGGSNLMDGFYNVTVTNPVIFTYQPTVPVPMPGMLDPALLQPTTLFKTAYVGLPLGMTQIPQSGVIS